MKHTIWSNGFEAIEELKEDIRQNYDQYNLEPDDEQAFWNLAYELSTEYLEDERVNLDCVITTDIILFADLGLWDGRRKGYRFLPSNNLKDVLNVCCGDYIDWYVDDNGEMIITDCHHDGTNRYIVRAVRNLSGKQIDNFYYKLNHGFTDKDMKHYTRRLGDYPAKVYGWKLRGGVHDA